MNKIIDQSQEKDLEDNSNMEKELLHNEDNGFTGSLYHGTKNPNETEEEKYMRKLRKSFLRSFWKNVNEELPQRSGTFWAHIVIETDLCAVSHQDRVYFYYPEKKFMSDAMAKEGGRVTHWAYPLPQPKDIH